MTLVQLCAVSYLEILDVLSSHIHPWQYLVSLPSKPTDAADRAKPVQKSAQRWFHPMHHWHQVSFLVYEGDLIWANWIIRIIKPGFHIRCLPLGRVRSCLELRMVQHESLCPVL